jgi:hypothetical protein
MMTPIIISAAITAPVALIVATAVFNHELRDLERKLEEFKR